jgi:16S rRNA (adenine1518-N6/adenine1519-N6)-dimethyltransferase
MIKKKSLGQHFLHSAQYLQMIIDAADITPGEQVLEVGPGDGALTAALLEKGANVVAIEKDHRLIPVLREKFKKHDISKQFKLHEADVLHYDISKYGFQGEKYKLVANIPYYITGALIRKFLTSEVQPTSMVLLIQKEVAQRIARDTKESLLSLSVKAYGEPKYIKAVPAGAFSPAPKVDSAILQVAHISRAHFPNKKSEEKFFTLIHAGFAQKRKLLKRNLELVLGKESAARLAHAGIPENARAEDVGLTQWLKLAEV